jgi:hypothetical protein
MTATATLLVVFSALLHSAWNYASKRERVSVAVFAWANALAVLFLLPVAVFGSAVLLRLPAAVLWLLLLTGLFQMFYFAVSRRPTAAASCRSSTRSSVRSRFSWWRG